LGKLIRMLEELLIGLQTPCPAKTLRMVIGGCLIGTFIEDCCRVFGPNVDPSAICMIPIAISLGDPSGCADPARSGFITARSFAASTSSILL